MKLAYIVEAKTDEMITCMNELWCEKLNFIKIFYFQICFFDEKENQGVSEEK